MTAKKTKEVSFSEFFREDAPEVQSIFHQPPGAETGTRKRKKKKSELPFLPEAEPAPEEEQKAWWQSLRNFFRSGTGGGLPTAKSGALYPALLAPFLDKPVAQPEFPLWVSESFGNDDPEAICRPLHDIIRLVVESFAPDDKQAALLKSVLPALEAQVRQKVSDHAGPLPAVETITAVLDEIRAKMHLKGEDKTSFEADRKLLLKALPGEGRLFPFSRELPVWLLAHILNFKYTTHRNRYLKKAKRLRARLIDLLDVERDKKRSAEAGDLKKSLDFAESHLNFEALASVIPTRGSEPMPEERVQRINRLIKTLSDAETLLSHPVILVQNEWYKQKSFRWKDYFPRADMAPVPRGKGSRDTALRFEARMKNAAELVATVRMAELEADGKYDPTVHNDYFESFDWMAFTREELQASPPVIYITDQQTLMNHELSDYSRLLATDMPVRIMVFRHEEEVDFLLNGRESGTHVLVRQELGAITISHRDAFTLQATTISPVAICRGITEGLDSFSPALFYLFNPSDQSKADEYIRAAAAVDSREFPGYLYRGDISGQWGSRFDISYNPQPENDWPIYTLQVRDEEPQEIAFTYADYIAIHKQFSGLFMPIPRSYWTDDLVPVNEYLAMDEPDTIGKIPYIWMVDPDNELHAVAVSWPVVLACRERLDFWHFLQENGGIRNYHVQQALARARKEWEAEKEAEIEALRKAHGEELEKVKEETAAEAMERLTAVLLDLDTNALIGTGLTTAPPATREPAGKEAAEQEQTAEAETGEKQEAEESLVSAEPWIETPLCTSCNECINLNDRMFAYDKDKMAYIEDPKAGTFADLVKAAEACPVKIIHPGEPLNPDEPGLDELRKRAEPFN